MLHAFSRTELLLGEAAVRRLARARVAVFGIGGVGGYVCEALARSGIGAFDLIDNDRVSLTNLNRQIIATTETIGQYKTEAMRDRIRIINPDAQVQIHQCFFLPENAGDFDFSAYDYVVDAVDTVTAKLQLVMACHDAGTPIISSMGAGNKLDPTAFRVADISRTKIDPLARVMRKELRARGINHLKVVYSEEEPMTPQGDSSDSLKENPGRRTVPGSIAFVPSAAGLIIAGEVIKDLTGFNRKPETPVSE